MGRKILNKRLSCDQRVGRHFCKEEICRASVVSFGPPLLIKIPAGHSTRTPLRHLGSLVSYPAPEGGNSFLAVAAQSSQHHPILQCANVQALPLSLLHRPGNPRITPILSINQEKSKHLDLKRVQFITG